MGATRRFIARGFMILLHTLFYCFDPSHRREIHRRRNVNKQPRVIKQQGGRTHA